MLPPSPERSGPPRAVPGSSAGARPRLPRWWLLVAAVATLIAIVVVASLVPVPYVALSPGSVRPVTDQVLVEGTPSFPPESSIAYTTASTGSASLLEAVVGWFDDDVDILPEEVLRGTRSAEENRRYNAQLMDTSKALAITVALRHLGEEVDVQTTGTVVRQLAPDGPAEAALLVDDVIVAVDGEPIDAPEKLGDLLQEGGVGASHVLTVERPAGGDTTIEVPITTVAAPDDAERAIIGIAPEDRIVGFDFPIDVTIDSGTVGGPSAGLAFTLAVLDVLTPGELTGGRLVAVTGTIRLDGTVGPVGAGAQKAVAVRRAGYDVFLVPSDEVDEVREAVGDDVEVIGVDTLAEALEALDSLGGDVGSLAAAGADSSP